METTTIDHNGITFEIPKEWRARGHRQGPPQGGLSLGAMVSLWTVLFGAAAGAVLGSLVPLVCARCSLLASVLIGSGGMGAFALMVCLRSSAKATANLPAIVKGPHGEFLLVWVWRLPSTAEIPPASERLQPDVPGGPLGGTVIERGTFKIGEDEHAWAVRESPQEAIVDEDWDPGRDVKFSADYEGVLPGSPPLQCRMYGVLTSANCQRKAEYDRIAGTMRRTETEGT